jgi:acyl-CoA thioester hydrolase
VASEQANGVAGVGSGVGAAGRDAGAGSGGGRAERVAGAVLGVDGDADAAGGFGDAARAVQARIGASAGVAEVVDTAYEDRVPGPGTGRADAAYDAPAAAAGGSAVAADAGAPSDNDTAASAYGVVDADHGAAASGPAPAETCAGSDSGGRSGGRRHVYLCPLRWADMDSFGHVNNVVYLRYLEQARVDWMFVTAKAAGVAEFSLGTVVARHTIEYKRPLVYRADPVRVEAWVTRIGNASFTVAYEVKDDDGVYATAETMLVPYNLSEGRPRRVTTVERRYIEQYLAVGDGGGEGVGAMSG